MGYYINYVFKKLSYDDEKITGVFYASDCRVRCKFSYNRITNKCEIRDNNKPVEAIEPLPIHWLLYTLEKKGKLNETESHICY